MDKGFLPNTSLEQLGLEAVKLGVPSVNSVCVGVDSEILWAGEFPIIWNGGGPPENFSLQKIKMEWIISKK